LRAEVERDGADWLTSLAAAVVRPEARWIEATEPKLLLENCRTAVLNSSGRSLAFAEHRSGESVGRIDVHSLQAIGKCQQRKSFSQPRVTAGRDRAA